MGIHLKSHHPRVIVFGGPFHPTGTTCKIAGAYADACAVLAAVVILAHGLDNLSVSDF